MVCIHNSNWECIEVNLDPNHTKNLNFDCCISSITYIMQTPNLEDLQFNHRPTHARKQGSLAPLEKFRCPPIGTMKVRPFESELFLGGTYLNRTNRIDHISSQASLLLC